MASLAIATVTVFAACSSGSSASATGSPSASSSGLQPATLTMSTNGTVPGLDMVIAAFEQAHPGVKINVTAIPSDNYQPTLRTELASGSAPDLMFVWGGSGNAMGVGLVAPTGNFLPLGNPSWAQGLPANVLTLYEYQGKLYAAPVNTYVSAFAYNKDVFTAAGISGPPQTWSDFLSDCAKIKAQGVTPLDLANGAGFLNMQIPAVLADDIVYSQDPTFGNDVLTGKISLATSTLWQNAVTTADSEYETLFKDGYVQPNSTATSIDQAIAAVAAGKAAMTHLIPSFQQLAVDNPQGSFGTFEVAATDTPGQIVVTEAPGSAFAVNAHSKYILQAQAFLNFLASPAEVDVLAQATQTFPLVAGATYTPGAIYAGIVPLMQQQKIAQNPTNYFTNDQSKQVWVAQAQLIASGSTTAAAATSALLATLSK